MDRRGTGDGDAGGAGPDPVRLCQPGPGGRGRPSGRSAPQPVPRLRRRGPGRPGRPGAGAPPTWRPRPSPGASRCCPRRSPRSRAGACFYRGQDAVDLLPHAQPGAGGPPAARRPRRAADRARTEEAQEGRDAARPPVLDPGRPGRDRSARPGPRAPGPGHGGRRPAGSRRRRGGRIDRRRPDPPAPGRRLEPGRLGRRPGPPDPGAAGRPRAERLDLRGAGGGLDRRLAGGRVPGRAGRPVGTLHGGMAARVEMFVDEAERRGPARAVAERLAQGSAMPGFGHPLYPDGDPRAAALLEAFKVPAVLAELRRETEAATGLPAQHRLRPGGHGPHPDPARRRAVQPVRRGTHGGLARACDRAAADGAS